MNTGPENTEDLSATPPSNTARAGLVSMAGTIVQVLIQVISLAVLARLLSPDDFGLYAMAMTFIGFSTLFKDMGLSTAAVQAKTLSRQARSNLFWINAGTGLALTLVSACSAPAVEAFFRHDGVALTVVLMSPTLLLAGLGVQYSASLQRDMRFIELTVINLVGGIAGLAVSIVVAVVWGGVWALAVPQLVAGVLTCALMAARAGWAPGVPRKDPQTRRLLAFGGGMFAAQLITYLHRNLDTVLVGRFYGAVWTGHLNRATQLTRMPLSMLTAPFAQIAVSKMSRHQDDDVALGRLMLAGQKLQAYPLLLAAGGLIAVSDQLVLLVMGPGWGAVTAFVRLVTIVEVFMILPSAAGWLLAARGQGRWLFRLGIVTAVVKAAMMAAGLAWGPYGVVAGNSLAALILWPLTLALAGRVTHVRTAPLLRQSLASIAYLTAPTVVAWWVANNAVPHMPALAILASAVAFLVAMAMVAAVAPSFRRDIQDVIRTVVSARR